MKLQELFEELLPLKISKTSLLAYIRKLLFRSSAISDQSIYDAYAKLYRKKGLNEDTIKKVLSQDLFGEHTLRKRLYNRIAEETKLALEEFFDLFGILIIEDITGTRQFSDTEAFKLHPISNFRGDE